MMNVLPFPVVPNEPLLRAQGLGILYDTPQGRVRATHDVGFEVWRGDRFVLLGPSGCGKSTLLKAVAGFVAPTEGSLLLDGRPIAGPGPDRIVVFQEFDQLPPWKTVRANVMFPLLAGGMARKEAEERALHWLEKVGLARAVDAYPHTLSGGMKARVAIARALAMQPAILLLDELTRRRMHEELAALWDEVRFTMLFVTHAIEEALVVGNRILLLSPHPGRVRAELNSHQFGLHSAGSAEFQAAHARIHHLLFGAPHEGTQDAPAFAHAAAARERA
jgi:NitT/TauT family transport system ATP-binding protein